MGQDGRHRILRSRLRRGRDRSTIEFASPLSTPGVDGVQPGPRKEENAARYSHVVGHAQFSWSRHAHRLRRDRHSNKLNNEQLGTIGSTLRST